MAGEAAQLRLGPLLRYVDGDSATVWLEADRPRQARVVCEDGTEGGARTWRIAGHHYALVTLTGLRPGTGTGYRVLLDGEQVWPPADSPYPPSVIRTTPAGPAPVTVTFGSCRWAAPPYEAGAGAEKDPMGPDALDALARAVADGSAARPDLLLLLGDQVYADETSAATRAWLAGRRDISSPPWDQVADYEEYTRLYHESWLDPEIRWLLSTVPSLMIFDDHDIIDDWNTSHAWRTGIRATGWWQERIVSGLASYWVHQHLGNLSPAELAADPLYATVRSQPDGTAALRDFAARADADPACARWSVRRDVGRVRVLMADTRAARVIDDEHHRAMVDPAEAGWLREQARPDGTFDHLLVGSSLPWLLPPGIHDAEHWASALCAGARGPRWAERAERLRQFADLEHWAAFPDSFRSLAGLLAEAGESPDAPATVCVLSGDVHHAYTAEARWPGRPLRSRVLQLTCSPAHNAVTTAMRAAFRLAWSPPGRLAGRVLARHGRTGRPPVDWRRLDGPWYGNQLMTLILDGRAARLRLDQARPGSPEPLTTVHESELSGP